jgi:hypothetical protein
MTAPVVHKVTRSAGIAGQYSMTASIEYPGEPFNVVTFVGSVFGGPIVMVTAAGETFVSQAVTDRLGSKLTEAWVRAFFGSDVSA